MATVYKKISNQNVKNKHVPLASSEDKAQALNIINLFVSLFKQKHL